MWQIRCIQLKILVSSISCNLVILYRQKGIFFKNALNSTANICDAWHLYSLVDGNGSYMLLLRMIEILFSLSRIHSLVFICLFADVTAVADWNRHLYSLVVDGDASYHMLLLRILETSFSSRIHSLVFIYVAADVTAVVDSNWQCPNVLYNTLLYVIFNLSDHIHY